MLIFYLITKRFTSNKITLVLIFFGIITFNSHINFESSKENKEID